MRTCLFATFIIFLFAFLAVPALAQQTSGNITGRIVDQSSLAMPGVTVTAVHTETGFSRTAVTDGSGDYRLPALPVGIYDLTAELFGFKTLSNKGLIVNVGQTIDIPLTLEVASLSETVNVSGETPMIQTTSSSVGGVVDVRRIESLPLNGRQFANLAATIPGVGLGFHSDPTKSTQYAPQIGGGNGRNINYQIDGGDNNDDTVGGLLQLFPLEAIQEFNMVTSRYKAEYGRSNGGVMNIVTKSGTNQLRGSWFTMFRDSALNAQTETERVNEIDKQDYRRWQYGGSFGGPIAKDRMHFFGAVERTQQDTFQAVNTEGLFPSLDGVFATPYRETLATIKVTANLNPKNYVSVRYGRNQNSQPYGAGPQSPPNNWGNSNNTFNSINLNHNLVVGASGVNEFIFQYADFLNTIGGNSTDPYQTFPNGVTVGANINVPQTTQQKKYQFRDDFSWYKSGWGGVGHSFKVGANFINEPRLFITFNSGKGVQQLTHLTDAVNGPISDVTVNGGEAAANIPLKQFAGYVQDDWRVNNRLTLNLGLRFDVITGYQFDQSANPNYVKVQNAGKAGQLAGIKGLENFGKDPKEDWNNWQPRIGFAYDVFENGTDLLRGGWGIYQDMGYTNSNGLFAAFDAQAGFGAVLSVANTTGIRNPDGSFYQVGQPLSNISSQNQADPNAFPLYGQFVDPRLQTPYTRQLAFGWSHELMTSTVVSADYVWNQGRDLNTRPRINTRPLGDPTGPRRLSFLGLSPNAAGTRAGSSYGSSDYKALILGFKRRMYKRVDLTASYTLQRAMSTIGSAGDELNSNNLQDSTQLYDDPRVNGPSQRTDARHSGSVSAVWQAPWGMTVAPVFFWRTALPVSTTTGVDTNGNGENNDLPAQAFQFNGVGNAPKDIGPCETYNCGRGAKRTQLNLRVSKAFHLWGSAQVEAIGEIFNLFNAKNPSTFVTNASSSRFMQPNEYAGDFQNPEQRVGQIGFRFSF
jgi:outer membrane receptor protein involved in Fe transport